MSDEPEYLHQQTKSRAHRYGKSRLNEPRPLKDRMGNELKVGDLITYILYNFQTTGGAIYVGTITKITPRNRDIYAKNIPLVAKEKSEEKKIKDLTGILKLEEDLIQQILLKKLTSATV